MYIKTPPLLQRTYMHQTVSHNKGLIQKKKPACGTELSIRCGEFTLQQTDFANSLPLIIKLLFVSFNKQYKLGTSEQKGDMWTIEK